MEFFVQSLDSDVEKLEKIMAKTFSINLLPFFDYMRSKFQMEVIAFREKYKKKTKKSIANSQKTVRD